MERRALGRTGLDVSIVSFGTAPLGGLFGSVDDSDTAQIVDEVLDSGINLIDTSPYYGLAEERLGRALTPSKRDKVILATKAGRYGIDDFDFSPKRIRESLDNSLRLMGTDYVDIFQLHDIEFVELNSIFEDGLAELHALKDAGKCRFIGMTGYPVPTFHRVIQETDLDVVLTYAKSTLLDDAFTTELLPLAEEKGVGMMNAAAVALGLLTPQGPRFAYDHPAPKPVQRAAAGMRGLFERRQADIAFFANQYSIQRSMAATTVIGSAKLPHIRSAIKAATTPIDEALLAECLQLRPARDLRAWKVGLEENN